jgi:hypothetical protein
MKPQGSYQMAKNRFAISTVFDIDERPFNQGIRNTTGTVNVFARKTTKRFSQMANDINNSMASFNNPFSGSFAMGGTLGLGAIFSGINSQNVLQAKYQAEAIGLTASELAALTPIAKKAGLESEHLTDIFEEMHNKVGLAKKGIFEGGLKDYGLSIGMDSKELNAFLKKDTMGQFEEIIDELNKLDLQTAIGLADGLFGGESNRLYRSLRVNFDGDLDAAKAYWATLNNLSDEGRKGNEEYAMAINDLTASLSTAFDDLTGKFGHELTPAIGYVTNRFNEFYRNGDHYLDLLSESISEHLDLSMDDVSKWTTGATALLGAVGTAWAAKKVTGKITGKMKQTLGLDKGGVQNVFVTNWPVGFGGGGYDPGLDNPFSNDKGGKTGKGGNGGKVGRLFGDKGLKVNLAHFGLIGSMLSQAEDYGSPINIRRASEVEMPDWAANIPTPAGLLDVYDDIRNIFPQMFDKTRTRETPLHRLNQPPSIIKNATNSNSLPIIQSGLTNQNQLKKDSDNLEKSKIALEALVANTDKPMSGNQTLVYGDTAIQAYKTNGFGG